MIPLQEAQDQSPVREIRSYKPHGEVKKKNLFASADAQFHRNQATSLLGPCIRFSGGVSKSLGKGEWHMDFFHSKEA